MPTHRLPAATRLPLLGQQMMVEVFALHAMVRAEVMDALCSRILSRGDAVHHWVALLQELVVQQPTLLLDHVPRRSRRTLELAREISRDDARSAEA